MIPECAPLVEIHDPLVTKDAKNQSPWYRATYVLQNNMQDKKLSIQGNQT